jgi:glycerophosphoryl diester phosphodiesterase
MMTRQVEVIGHRGARGLFPENTIDGFRQAWTMGVRSFELDVGMTADGVVVVSHDLALNPDITRDSAGHFLTSPTPVIHSLSLDALHTYDVGRIRPTSRYRFSHRAQKPSDGARIPTLEQVMRAAPEARFIIELKTDPRHLDWTAAPPTLADAVLAVVDAAGAAARVVLESFDWRGPRHIRRVRPEIKTAWLTREETVRDAALWWDGITPERYGGSVPATVAAQGDDGLYWAPAFDVVTQAQVAEAHERGLRVVPWTVNRRAAMRRLVGWGVDGLITDRPDVALKIAAGEINSRHSA